MKLVAYTRTPDGLFKIYDQGEDWQIIGAGFERWCSKWQADPAASLMRAVEMIPQVDPASITYTAAPQHQQIIA